MRRASIRVRPIRRSACAFRASTTTWRRWVTTPTTTPCSRCWATGPTATISRRRPSSGPGSCCTTSTDCLPSGYTPPSSRVRRRTACLSTRRPTIIGSVSCPRTTSSAATSTITSGRWARRVPAAPVPKSTSTCATKRRSRPYPAARWSTGAIRRSSRFGTSSSCSSTARPTVRWRSCPRAMSTRAWASSVSA